MLLQVQQKQKPINNLIRDNFDCPPNVVPELPEEELGDDALSLVRQVVVPADRPDLHGGHTRFVSRAQVDSAMALEKKETKTHVELARKARNSIEIQAFGNARFCECAS